MPESNPPADGPPLPDGGLDAQLYAELRALAGSFLGRERVDHTLQPTALVHEAWIRLSGEDDARWADRTHFFRVAAQVMRRVLVDHARRKQADKRGGDQQRITMATGITPSVDAPEELDVLALDEALQQLAKLDESQARVVELRFFAGLTVDEVAQAVGVSPRTVATQWRLARAWLLQALADGESA